MSRKIQFVTTEKEIHDKVDIPKPTKSYIPNWYKKSDNFIGGQMKFLEGGLNKDLKLCMPFLDSMMSGYTVELHCDLHVERQSDGSITFSWGETPAPIAMRNPDMAATLPRPAGHAKDMYAWVMPYGPYTPKGYSCLFTHPLNRFDLPFTTVSGISETDNYPMPGEVPFFFKAGFEGILPAGTPILQIIPFKRENWTSSQMPFDEKFNRRTLYQVTRTFFGGYKKLHWVRKNYE